MSESHLTFRPTTRYITYSLNQPVVIIPNSILSMLVSLIRVVSGWYVVFSLESYVQLSTHDAYSLILSLFLFISCLLKTVRSHYVAET